MPTDTIENKKKIMVIIPIIATQYLEDVRHEVERVLAPDFSADYTNVKQGLIVPFLVIEGSPAKGHEYNRNLT